MHNRKIIVYGLIGTLALGSLLGIAGNGKTDEGWTLVVGVAMFTFGIWAAVVLLKHDHE